MIFAIPTETSERLLCCLTPIFLEFPFAVVERTDLTGLQPAGNAMKVEGVIANTPGNSTLFAGGTGLICLALNTKVHNMIPADRTVVYDNIPSPECDCVPLLDLKTFRFLASGAAAGASVCSICHILIKVYIELRHVESTDHENPYTLKCVVGLSFVKTDSEQ